MIGPLVTVLCTYFLHSSAFLLCALLLDRLRLLRRAAHVEAMWRAALLAGLLTTAAAGWSSGPGHLQRAGPRPVVATASISATAPATAPVAGTRPVAAHAMTARATDHRATDHHATRSATLRARPLLLPEGAGVLAAALALAWCLVALLRIAAVGLHWLRLARTARALPACNDAALLAFIEHEARAAGRAIPSLRVSRQWPSPLVAPGGRICIPQWCLAGLDGSQREAVVAHELAHVLRRDVAWRLAVRVVCALGWLQPLNVVAARRLDVLAELACDGWAARNEVRRDALAHSLLLCAQAMAGGRVPRAAAAMASSHSPLVLRVARLVTGGPMEQTPASRRYWFALAAVVAVLAVTLPAVALRVLPDMPPLRELLGFERGPVRHITARWPDGHYELTIRGPVTLAADESAVLRVADRLDIEESRDGHVTSAWWNPGKDAPAPVHYAVDGVEQPLDGRGREWVAAQLPKLAGAVLGTEGRLHALESIGGVESVLRVVEGAGDAESRLAFIQALAARPTLDAAVLQRLLAASAVLDDARSRSLALQALAGHRRLDASLQARWLEIAATVEGEDLLRETLLAMVPRFDDSTETRSGWEKSLAALRAGYQVQPVIAALAARQLPGEATARLLVQAAQRLDRDEDRATAIELLGGQVRTLPPALAIEAAALAHSIGNGFERRRALLALASRASVDGDTSVAILQALDGLEPADNVSAVLLALAAHMPADRAVAARARLASRVLGPFERGQLEQAMDRLALD